MSALIEYIISLFAIGFSIVSTVATLFGKLPAIIAAVTIAVVALGYALWSAATAFSVLTLGAAAIAGGAAIAGAMAASSPDEHFGVYQMGTSFVRKGGIAVVHEGEEIKSARESRPTSRMGDGGHQFRRTSTTFNLNVYGNLETKSDNETLMPAVRRVLKEELDKKV